MNLRLRAARAWLAWAAVSLLIGAIATFPLLTRPFDRLIGHPDVDASNHAWGPWWWWVTLGRGDLPWRTELLGAPAGGVLWFIDPFSAAIGAPFVGVLGAIGAYNLTILVSVSLAAFATRTLARALGAGPGSSWIAGAAAAFGPYLLSEVHNGVSEAVGVAWATFALAAARRALAGEDASDRPWLRTGVWLAVAAAGTWYYGFATGVTIGAWALLAGLDAPAGQRLLAARRPVRGATLAGLTGVLLASPVLAVVYLSISSPSSLVVRGELDDAVRERLLAHNAVDPRAFFAPGGFQSVDLAANGESFLHSSYLGLAALVLAAIAVRADRSLRPVVLGVLPAAVLSLGAWLWWDGAWVSLPVFGRLSLPFGWLAHILPDAGVTHAQRLAWPAIATVAALAAVGAERAAALLPAARRLALVVLGALVAADMLASSPWPLARAAPLDVDAHRRVRALAKAELALNPNAYVGVLDLPAEVGPTMATSVYLLYQTATGLPIPYRPDARGGTAELLGTPAFNLLFYPSATRRGDLELLARQASENRPLDIAALETIGGIRWVIVHRELERGRGDVARIETLLRSWLGDPEVFGTHLIYDVQQRAGGPRRGPANPTR